ncbi:hypothetical protein AtubIFM55763_006991 [Aspergillus tubingensis]|uniref:Similar to An11g08670 n=1 Tax=Aspergillus niger TaxID=5061 RepID=A0A100I4Y8_ASPNG|nr:similar to An11g08670 [Aspergillus niger]GLA68792.1 hypothetical protein AtubIFM55763_006991 [Aspergillus tubingensis]GLA97481.1 hypothetical protein AtubIFM57143_005407 [Aspergillus tubingensis]GLB15436.1 hypothetical protein AtubIFM61612_005257 [Aspergillus tubingensis]
MASRKGRAVSLKGISRTVIIPPKVTTQADRIPDDLPDFIPGVPLILKDTLDFPNWDFQVRQILENVGLQDLVDSDIPHPKLDHKTYTRWRECSKALQSWLTGQISDELLLRFRLTVDKKGFADEAYKVIKMIILEHGIVRCENVVYDLVKKTRADYSTTSQYVEDFKSNYVLAKELQCGLPPFTASLLMLKEIRSDFPAWVASVEYVMPVYVASTYTEDDFFTLCRVAIELCAVKRLLRMSPLSAPGAATAPHPENDS